MDNISNEFTCPCMPQCPNYGKCRECILEHGKYYTVPKCVKLMQDEMKQKHIHPVNPHVKKPLAERISEFYEKNPGSHLRTVAEELKVTEWQVLDAMETTVKVPVEDFADIYGKLRELDQVMLHLDAGSVVLQLATALPEALDRMGTMILKADSDSMSLTSLMFAKSFYSMFLVREVLYGGKESLSLAIVGEDEKIALSIYMRRSDANTIEPKSKALFESLWDKYKN